jgi:hypothetical protein
MIILGIAAGVVLVAVVGMILFFTRPPEAAVTSTPSATATATPPRTSTPTPSPTSPTEAPASQASEVSVTRDGFTVLADDGTALFTFAWTDEVDPAVEALTRAIGQEPATSEIPGNPHLPPYAVYDWDGFRLFGGEMDGQPRTESFKPSFVEITANTVGALEVISGSGPRIGMPLDEARSLGPDEEWVDERGTTSLSFDRGPSKDHGDPEINPDGAPGDQPYFVRAEVTPADGVVTLLSWEPYSWA